MLAQVGPALRHWAILVLRFVERFAPGFILWNTYRPGIRYPPPAEQLEQWTSDSEPETA